MKISSASWPASFRRPSTAASLTLSSSSFASVSSAARSLSIGRGAGRVHAQLPDPRAGELRQRGGAAFRRGRGQRDEPMRRPMPAARGCRVREIGDGALERRDRIRRRRRRRRAGRARAARRACRDRRRRPTRSRTHPCRRGRGGCEALRAGRRASRRARRRSTPSAPRPARRCSRRRRPAPSHASRAGGPARPDRCAAALSTASSIAAAAISASSARRRTRAPVDDSPGAGVARRRSRATASPPGARTLR